MTVLGLVFLLIILYFFIYVIIYVFQQRKIALAYKAAALQSNICYFSSRDLGEDAKSKMDFFTIENASVASPRVVRVETLVDFSILKGSKKLVNDYHADGAKNNNNRKGTSKTFFEEEEEDELKKEIDKSKHKIPLMRVEVWGIASDGCTRHSLLREDAEHIVYSNSIAGTVDFALENYFSVFKNIVVVREYLQPSLPFFPNTLSIRS